MLTRLLIKNFQSHKYLVLDLSKGINVFVGISDKGKTGIIRAIRWVVWNKPSGKEFRSWWGGDCIVQFTFDDGNVITRKKSNSENTYDINGTIFEAFGQGVPEEVTRILNMHDVNIQNQHDAPFLLDNTPGEVANHFNKVAGISIINKSISNAKSAVAKTKQSIEHWEEDLTEKQEQYKQYENLDELEQSVKYLEHCDKKKKKLVTDKTVISIKLQRLKEIKVKLEEKETLLSLEKPIKALFDKQSQLKNKKQGEFILKSKVTRALFLGSELKRIDIILANEIPVKLLIEQQNKLKQKRADFKALKALVGKYITLDNKVQENAEKLVKFNLLLPDVCPICKGTGKLK